MSDKVKPSDEKLETLKVQKTTEKEPEKTKEPSVPASPAGGPSEKFSDLSVEKKPSEPKIKEKPKKVKVSGNLSKIIEKIEKLSVLELNELVKALEEKFGIPQVVPLSGTPSGQVTTTPTAGATPPEAVPQQTTFNVILASAGANKISVIKAVREVKQNMGLKEAKDFVEASPKELLSGVNKETAEEAKKKIEAAGATVELK